MKIQSLYLSLVMPKVKPPKGEEVNEAEFKSKLLLVEEAIEDWKKGELTDFTTMIILKQIISPSKPSPECERWAREVCIKNEINCAKPTFPEGNSNSLVNEGDAGPYCPECDSSLKKKLLFFRSSYCIQPKCKNYYREV